MGLVVCGYCVGGIGGCGFCVWYWGLWYGVWVGDVRVGGLWCGWCWWYFGYVQWFVNFVVGKVCDCQGQVDSGYNGGGLYYWMMVQKGCFRGQVFVVIGVIWDEVFVGQDGLERVVM